MSTTFAIDAGSAVQGESSSVEDDSSSASRYVAMAVQRHRQPPSRRFRRNVPRTSPALHCSPVAVSPGTDRQTEDRCREALRWITTLPDGTVQVRVQAGRVTLIGKVRRANERDVAADTVRQIEGVADVDNQIDVQ